MKTNIVSARFAYSRKSTISHLDVDLENFGYTLEDRIRRPGIKVHGLTCIPAGTYRLTKRASPKFKRDVIWLRDVPLFEYVYCHAGNKAEDTDGCILPALMRTGPDFIGGNSLAIERKMFNLIDSRGWENATWTVVNLPGFEDIIDLP